MFRLFSQRAGRGRTRRPANLRVEELEPRTLFSVNVVGPWAGMNLGIDPGPFLRGSLAPLQPLPPLASIAGARPGFTLLNIHPASVPAGAGFSPDQIRTAYGINSITFSNGTLTGDGTGQ